MTNQINIKHASVPTGENFPVVTATQRLSPFQITALVFSALFSTTLYAQNFSYDGNRWYEIEISIFQNQESAGRNDELTIPEKTRLSYPEDIIKLTPASSSFIVPFESPLRGPPESPFGQSTDISSLTRNGDLPAGNPDSVETGMIMVGPPLNPGESDFKVSDFTRDPYIALGDNQAEFMNYNERIARSGEHRLLFHAVWRQPVLNRVQATAIVVSGGQQFGEHTELEGSLRFSYNVNRVDLEANLWLLEFAGDFPARSSKWDIPAPPFPPAQGIPPSGLNLGTEYTITHMAHMNQVRSMTSNTLHYLDHPDIGILVEIRPYQLPVPAGFGLD